MDTTWKTTLLGVQSLAGNDTIVNVADLNNLKRPRIYPLTHLSSLSITGKDATKLLQGQLTCNVNEISEKKSNITALCNPKGRVIATFLLVKKADTFVLILPSEMLEIVRKRLHMYVLRSDVKIKDTSNELCLLGINEPRQSALAFSTEIEDSLIKINLPGKQNRKLLIADAEMGLRYWSEFSGSQSQNTYQQGSTNEWRYLDIICGLPWVSLATSEEFIPQMLNLDKLGGISFNKGCYTGQEIVARTHYLGKAKREVVLAECETTSVPDPNANVINADSEDKEAVGKVFMAQQHQDGCVMQIVLQINDGGYRNLAFEHDDQHTIKLIPFLA